MWREEGREEGGGKKGSKRKKKGIAKVRISGGSGGMGKRGRVRREGEEGRGQRDGKEGKDQGLREGEKQPTFLFLFQNIFRDILLLLFFSVVHPAISNNGWKHVLLLLF